MLDIDIEVVLHVVFGMVAGGPLWLLFCLAVIRHAGRRYAQRKHVDWRSKINDAFDDSDDVRPVWRAVKVIPPRWRVVDSPIVVDCEVVDDPC